MTEIKFRSGFEVFDHIEGSYTDLDVEAETMLFTADADFAYARGGPLTRLFIDKLPQRFKYEPLIIDTRSHMLMPGWYPCIPGWHLDDIPRNRPDGQPDHVNPEYVAEHAMMIVGDASRTAFAVGEFTLSDLPIGGGIVYGEWHRDLSKIIEEEKVKEVLVNEKDIIIFNHEAFHRGTQATKNGWRYFIRATRGSKRKAINKIRKQVQVYMPAPDAGW